LREQFGVAGAQAAIVPGVELLRPVEDLRAHGDHLAGHQVVRQGAGDRCLVQFAVPLAQLIELLEEGVFLLLTSAGIGAETPVQVFGGLLQIVADQRIGLRARRAYEASDVLIVDFHRHEQAGEHLAALCQCLTGILLLLVHLAERT